MSIIVEYVLESPILRETLERLPHQRAILVRVDLSEDRMARLTFWATGDPADFAAAMAADRTVDDYTRLSAAEDRTLFRIDVSPELRPRLTYGTMLDVDGILTSAVARADGWHSRARFPDREALAQYHDACREADIPFDLERIYSATDSEPRNGSGLTDPQREVLQVALDVGYFEIPRCATTGDIGERLGISGQAVSERLRRALRVAAERTLRE